MGQNIDLYIVFTLIISLLLEMLDYQYQVNNKVIQSNRRYINCSNNFKFVPSNAF